MAPAFALGPFLSFSLGQYGTPTCYGAGCGEGVIDGDIKEKPLHQWLTLGVRGVMVVP